MGVRVLISLSMFVLLCFPQNTYGSVVRMNTSRPHMKIDPTQVTQLSWKPRAFLYKGFLSNEECDHLIKLANGNLEKSTVVDGETGESILGEERTSSGTALLKSQDDVVDDIEARIAAWTFLPQENGEAIQILRYEHAQKYDPHFDFFQDKANQALGGNRVATVLMYLSDVDKGGETVFPIAESQAAVDQPKDDSWSDWAKGGYAVKPRKGDAVLFFNLHPNATVDMSSLHGSCPVLEGEKWSATKWIHVSSFNYGGLTRWCEDEKEMCPLWAKAGECEKNPRYMTGAGGLYGFCRKSCNAC